MLVWLLLVSQFVSFAQNDDEVGKKPKPQKLPRLFAAFSNDAVLKAIFPDYNPKTGRVASILNDENLPSLVRINQARLWQMNGQQYLVVLADIAGNDDDFVDLCGACAMYAILAVLKRDGNYLSVIAKQQPPKHSSPSDTQNAQDNEDAVIYGGHDIAISLDLAPYRLNSKETLIGLRMEHMWMQLWGTNLSLYRIEGSKLREVFSDTVVDREYPNQPSTGEIIKTVSTVSPIIANSNFYDYRIRKTIPHCINSDDNCGSKRDKIKQIKTKTELWRFNGEKFEKVNKSK